MDTYGPEALNFASVRTIQEALAGLTAARATDPAEFERTIRGYLEMSLQPPFNEWGHDHDFGSFQAAGRMGTRHVWMLSRLLDHFDVSVEHDISHRRVLDIGCWTGGTSLVLARLGAQVTAIDDNAYLPALQYMADAWQLTNLTVEQRGIDDLSASEQYDTVLLLGVIYHVENPLASLRRVRQVLRPGGLLCVESMAIDDPQPRCGYLGPSLGRVNAGYVPSPRALEAWLRDAGFVDAHVGNGLEPLAVTSDTDPMGGCRTFATARVADLDRASDRADAR